jgi:hypothetical protein
MSFPKNDMVTLTTAMIVADNDIHSRGGLRDGGLSGGVSLISTLHSLCYATN